MSLSRTPADGSRPQSRIGSRAPTLSAVLRGVRGVRQGQLVEVVLGSGRITSGYVEWIDDGVIRVRLPDDAR